MILFVLNHIIDMSKIVFVADCGDNEIEFESINDQNLSIDFEEYLDDDEEFDSEIGTKVIEAIKRAYKMRYDIAEIRIKGEEVWVEQV